MEKLSRVKKYEELQTKISIKNKKEEKKKK